MTGLAAAAPPVALSVAAKGSALHLAFTNTTRGEIAYETRVRADIDHYDWLSVTLAKPGATTRTFTFAEDRDKSAAIATKLAPGKAATE